MLRTIIFIVIAIAICATSAFALTLERTRLVDSRISANAPSAFLFRNDVPDWREDNSHFAPTGNVTFEYETLLHYYSIRLAQHGIKMPPPPYFLIDVNLLSSNSSQQQTNAIGAERDFFAANPQKGMFVHWPIHGVPPDVPNPQTLPENEREEFFLNFSYETHLNANDRLGTLTDMLHRLVHDPRAAAAYFNSRKLPNSSSSSTLLVGYHCIGDIDRGGDVSASYAMRYLGYSAQQALAWDTKVGGRMPHTHQRWGMQWFCFWLARQGLVSAEVLRCDKMYS